MIFTFSHQLSERTEKCSTHCCTIACHTRAETRNALPPCVTSFRPWCLSHIIPRKHSSLPAPPAAGMRAVSIFATPHSFAMKDIAPPRTISLRCANPFLFTAEQTHPHTRSTAAKQPVSRRISRKKILFHSLLPERARKWQNVWPHHRPPLDYLPPTGKAKRIQLTSRCRRSSRISLPVLFSYKSNLMTMIDENYDLMLPAMAYRRGTDGRKAPKSRGKSSGGVSGKLPKPNEICFVVFLVWYFHGFLVSFPTRCDGGIVWNLVGEGGGRALATQQQPKLLVQINNEPDTETGVSRYQRAIYFPPKIVAPGKTTTRVLAVKQEAGGGVSLTCLSLPYFGNFTALLLATHCSARTICVKISSCNDCQRSYRLFVRYKTSIGYAKPRRAGLVGHLSGNGRLRSVQKSVAFLTRRERQ